MGAAASRHCPHATGRLDALARAYLGFAVANPGMFELMSSHDLPEGRGVELRRTTLPLFLTFVGLVTEVHPQSDDPAAATAALWSNLHGLAQLRTWGSLRLITGDDSVEPLLRATLDAHLGPSAR
ncbi:TetR-like C-terminal domain-containing protein [Kitasatospora sp. MY 5-36]|uniref:TetR-like C-terminal domain-containing protein n=1 Tax=Kitasatospora sp. MY 5-36 TaxID=1678027 RepID=UPI00131C0160|nr:TetR-like C-terminal domain-containing protein [Kitasatospora sp. MY 5-36]